MKTKTFLGTIIVSAMLIIVCSCSKDQSLSTKNGQASVLNNSKGATQISGVSYFDEADGCDAAGAGAAYALNMTGDLNGCLYTYVDSFECSPSGTYREIGREHFVGTYKGVSGTFWTNYKFEAKYEGCAENGSYVGLEIKGRCQHPIAEGSGTGVFNGLTGRLNMRDDLVDGNYPYTGHLNF
jgi:hypothetical protein